MIMKFAYPFPKTHWLKSPFLRRMAAQSEINRLLFPSVRKSVRYNFGVFAYEIKVFSCTVNILRIRLTKLCELDILILIN